jgi:hypothetical protein
MQHSAKPWGFNTQFSVFSPGKIGTSHGKVPRKRCIGFKLWRIEAEEKYGVPTKMLHSLNTKISASEESRSVGTGCSYVWLNQTLLNPLAPKLVLYSRINI